MTFNELSVRLFELTADVTSGTSLEDALWLLVGDGCVALTYEAPIQWCRTCDLQGVQDTAPRYEVQPRFEAEPEVLERGLELSGGVRVNVTPEPSLSELPLFAGMKMQCLYAALEVLSTTLREAQNPNPTTGERHATKEPLLKNDGDIVRRWRRRGAQGLAVLEVVYFLTLDRLGQGIWLA